MTKENKRIYVIYDEENEKSFYSLLKAQCEEYDKNLFFASSLSKHNFVDCDFERSSIKRIRSFDVVVFLISDTSKYMSSWTKEELEESMRLKKPMIAVNLNGARSLDIENCPSILANQFILFVSFNAAVVCEAIKLWPQYHTSHLNDTNKCNMYFTDDVYNRLQK